MPNDTLLITLAEPNPNEPDTFHAYVGGSTELAIDAGGEVSSRYGVRHLHGDAPATVFGLATFPSAGAITDMFASADYQALIPAREAGIDSVNAYVVAGTPITELPALAEEAVYLVTVAAPNPNAPDDLATYQRASGPLAGKHGAKPVAQLPISGHPVGDNPAAFVAIAEFPSADAVQAFFDDPDYVAVTDVRDRALRSLNLYVSTN